MSIASLNENKVRDEELAAATAHYLRMSKEFFRARDRAVKSGRHEDHLALCQAIFADGAASDRLEDVLSRFPEDEALKQWREIWQLRRKLTI